MRFVVYIDVFFGVNFCMDMIILFILKILSKQKSSMLRIILAGVFGGMGACITVICPGLNLLLKFLLLYVIISMGMIIIAFSYQGFWHLIRNVIKLYFISFFVGGLYHFLYYNVRINDFIKERLGNEVYQNVTIHFLIGAGIILLILIPFLVYFYQRMRRKQAVIYQVELWEADSCVKGLGLYDTGNSLKDPLSGKPVIIAEYDVVKSMFSYELQEYIQQFFAISVPSEASIAVKWIPYHSLGNKNGFLPAMEFQQLIVNIEGRKQKVEKVLVGMYQGKLSVNGEYQFILHEDYLSTNY